MFIISSSLKKIMMVIIRQDIPHVRWTSVWIQSLWILNGRIFPLIIFSGVKIIIILRWGWFAFFSCSFVRIHHADDHLLIYPHLSIFSGLELPVEQEKGWWGERRSKDDPKSSSKIFRKGSFSLTCFSHRLFHPMLFISLIPVQTESSWLWRGASSTTLSFLSSSSHFLRMDGMPLFMRHHHPFQHQQ